MQGNTFILTLCYKCRNNFGNTEKYHINRISKNQHFMEKCTYCNSKYGYDYKLIPKKEKEKDDGNV